MKVARKHIIQAVENAGKLQFFPKYAIKALKYTGDKFCRTEGKIKSGEFGWIITVLPKS